MGAFTALGAGGQFIFIVPDKNLAIVMTSEPQVVDEVSLESEFFNLAQLIIDSIVDQKRLFYIEDTYKSITQRFD